MAGTAPRDQFDTGMVRTLFRRIVSVGALMIGAICAVHTGVLLWHGMPWWWSSAAVGMLALMLRPCFAPEKPFPVFQAATIGRAGAVALPTPSTCPAGWRGCGLSSDPLRHCSRGHGQRPHPLPRHMVDRCHAGRGRGGHRGVGASLATDPAMGRQAAAALTAFNLAGIGLAIAALMVSCCHLVSVQQSRLQELVVRDPLTGLFNRRFAYES
ncbi:MAG: hypothetical protein V4679_11540 [Pseudomonadota bacterium]